MEPAALRSRTVSLHVQAGGFVAAGAVFWIVLDGAGRRSAGRLAKKKRQSAWRSFFILVEATVVGAGLVPGCWNGIVINPWFPPGLPNNALYSIYEEAAATRRGGGRRTAGWQ